MVLDDILGKRIEGVLMGRLGIEVSRLVRVGLPVEQHAVSAFGQGQFVFGREDPGKGVGVMMNMSVLV